MKDFESPFKEIKQANGNYPMTDDQKIYMIEKAAEAYGIFLSELGFDWESDPNSQDTPRRVAKAWVNDLAKGCFNHPPKITTFPADYSGITFQGNIKVVSMCSHHNLPFTGVAHVAYFPGEKVIGLSKLNRIVDWYSRRPQIQEGLTHQIHTHLNEILEDNNGIAVVIEANHTCCSNRGIGHDSTMKTALMSKYFLDNKDGCKDEFYKFIDRL
jgi:GTP cyclohydrolase IA